VLRSLAEAVDVATGQSNGARELARLSFESPSATQHCRGERDDDGQIDAEDEEQSDHPGPPSVREA
jgi:hypothetical protein